MAGVVSQLIPQAVLLFITTLAAFATALFCSRFMVNTVRRLRNNAIALGAGNTAETVIASGPTEIRELAAAFSAMAESIKARETSLRNQHEWLKITISSIGDAVLATDMEGNIIFFNPVAEALTGWGAEEATGRPFQDIFRIIDERTREPAENIVVRVLREGCIIGLANHTALLNREGREIPIEDSAAPIKDQEGNILGVVLVFHDVTEKRRSLEALRESEQKNRFLAGILKLSSQPFAVGYPDGRIGLVNSAFEHLTGYTVDELQLIDWANALTPPEWRIFEQQRLEELNRTGNPIRYEKEYIRKDGTRVPIELLVQLVTDSDGKPECYYSFLTDITERKQAEKVLRQKEAELSEAQRIANIGNWYWDAKTDITTGSDELLRIYGFDPATQRMPNFMEQRGLCYPEEEWERLNVAVQKSVETGIGYELEVRALRERNPVWITTRGEVVKGNNGQIVGLRGTVQDITERKRAEILLQRQAELLHMSDESIIVWRFRGTVESWNRGAEKLYGYSPEEAVGQVTHDLLKTIFPEPWPQIEATLREQKFWEGELKHQTSEEQEIIVSARLQLVRGSDGVERVLETNRDITEQKRIVMEREVTVELLKIVNQSSSIADMVKAATTFFQRESDCEAVGIRLKEGEDFPYFEARGFPEEFVRLENSLCARDAMGDIIRDSLGDPCIECMCGNVILERVDPSKPFFSSGGSFWANSTTRLLATTSDEERQTGTRNRCNGEGYESVALIPLHLGAERLGLIQLNDRRKGIFSAETIAVWERLAGYLAVALAKSLSDEKIQYQNAILETINQIFYKALTCATEEELGVACLTAAETLTESMFGFIGRIGSDGLLHDIALTNPGWELCTMYDKSGHRRPPGDFKLHGLYGRVLLDGKSMLTNDPSSHPDSIGTPEGHPPLTSFLGVPLMQEGKTIGMLGLGNREGGYKLEHQQAVEAIAPAIVQTLLRKRAEAHVTADLAGLTRMHALSGRLLETGGIQSLLQEIMDAAVSIVGAEKGTLQLLEGDSLRIVAAYGHQRSFIEFFASAENTASVCGEATRCGERVVVSDVETSSLFIGTPSLAVLREAGVRAVQSTPMMSRNGALLGILTTQWGVPYTPNEHDLWRIDLLARQAADLIEHSKSEDALLKSRDELELRVLERTVELKSYMAKLEQSNQALQDFAHIAAHDMKEPLRKVISFGNMLRQKSGDSLGQSGNDYLNRMLHATERMQSLLAGLLDYSKVATTSEPFKEIDLSDLISEVLSDLEVRIVKTGGKVQVGTLPVISADPTQMRRLFQNLIGNALKFHKDSERPVVKVSSGADNGYLQIIVEDNGIGFEEQYLEKIFAPFQRLHGKSSQYEGTGMGLAICKKIVERHGGSITATSAPGAGTRFIVRFPLRQST
ncbi:MAG: PAS domain S-box protein [Syntrophobacteraceae bacterium]